MSRKAVWFIVVSVVAGAAALLCLALLLNADSAMKRAREAWRRADYERALPLFDAVIKEQPERADAWMLRGNTHWELKRYHEALRDSNEAIRLNPSLTDAYFYRSNAYFALGQWEAAVRDKTVIIEREPENADMLMSRSRNYDSWLEEARKGGNAQLAARLQALMRADLKKAGQLDPKRFGTALQDYGQ